MAKVSKEELERKSKEALKKGGKTLHEFREFISRGNVLDMAVGVIVGGAFGKIVTSLVNNILMPIIGIIIGGIDFSGLSITIGTGENPAVVEYGLFIQNVIDFLIVAACIFFIVKIVSKATERRKKEKEEAPVQAPAKSDEVVLLEEIRDLLKKKK